MNSDMPQARARVGSTCLAIAIVSLVLSGCSTPHGYGVDERAMRTPDGSSGVVVGEAQAGSEGGKSIHNQSTYLSLITQMQHEGQYFASLAHLDSYDASYGRSPESILLRGDAERLTDQPELAIRSYTALKDTPLAGAGYHGLSLLAGARGDFTSAAGLLEEALRFNSTDAVTLSDLGYARLKIGNLAAARVPLMTAAQLTPGNPKVMSNVALYFILDHDSKQAEAVMKSAGVSAQTRQAIYAQASQMSQGSVAALAQSANAAAAASARVAHAKINSVIESDQSAPLRIDFALALPVPSSAGDVTQAAASSER